MITVTKVELPSSDDYKAYIDKIWQSGLVTNNGPLLVELEEQLSEYLKVRNFMTVTNGTLALQLPLKGLGLKGEVITTPFTFAATTNTIVWEGLKPVFADIDPDTYNIDPKSVRKLVTPDTCAILAVHVYGNPCDLKSLKALADEFKLKLIYDAAHAFGVDYNNKGILTFGDISTLSFHATKVFNTIEGGAIVVNANDDFERLKKLRNFGLESDNTVSMPGINTKMNEFQAAMGLCNLPEIDNKIAKRKEIYDYYKSELQSIPGLKFQKLVASRYNYSYMPVHFSNKARRDKVADKLAEKEIFARKYFYPLTSESSYLMQKNEDLTNANYIADGILCLPMYSTLDRASQDLIIKTIKESLE